MSERSAFPRLLGRYALLRPLAEHRSSGVYLAIGGGRGRESLCVLKTRLRVERPLAGIEAVNHPAFAALLEHDRVGDEAFVALERIDGRDLHTTWNRCAERQVAFPIGVACAIAIDVLDGLAALHQAGRVHGLLSPGKVMVTFDGQVKLVDFQLTPAFIQSAKLVSRTTVGRPGYLAPEQVAGERPTAASDIFAIGVILWELLVGRPLFPRRGWATDGGLGREHVLVSYEKAVAAGTPRPSQVCARVPPEIDDLLVRALATSPADRFATASDFRSELTRVLAPHRFARASVGPFVQGLYEQEILSEQSGLEPLIQQGRALLNDPANGTDARPSEVPSVRPAGGVRQLQAARRSPPTSRRAGLWAFAGGVGIVAIVSVVGLRAGWVPLRSVRSHLDRRSIGAPPPQAPHHAVPVLTATSSRSAPSSTKTAVPTPPRTSPSVALVEPIAASALPVTIEVPAKLAPPEPAARPAARPHRKKRRRPQPEATVPTADEPVDTLLANANRKFDQGELTEALGYAEKAVEHGGGAAALVLAGDTHVSLGRHQASTDGQMGEFRRALALYERALAADPSSTMAQRGKDYVNRLLSGELSVPQKKNPTSSISSPSVPSSPESRAPSSDK